MSSLRDCWHCDCWLRDCWLRDCWHCDCWHCDCWHCDCWHCDCWHCGCWDCGCWDCDFNRNAMAADSLGRESEETGPSNRGSRNATAGVRFAKISRLAIKFIGTQSCRRFATLRFGVSCDLGFASEASACRRVATVCDSTVLMMIPVCCQSQVYHWADALLLAG